MILIDVGNTNIVFAVSANNLLKKIKRIKTNEDKNKLKKLINKIIIDLASTNRLDDDNIAIISSPISPFFMDNLFIDLTDSSNSNSSSVHLSDFPEYCESLINEDLQNGYEVPKATVITYSLAFLVDLLFFQIKLFHN
mgnify:CR=1 FL=1